nr:salivary glue protein Sgs-3-like [Ipomoea trifida]
MSPLSCWQKKEGESRFSDRKDSWSPQSMTNRVNQRRRNTKKKTSQVPPTAQQPVAAQVPQSAQELAAAPLPQSAQQPATAQGSLIEEIQHFWNEAERVASLFDIQVGVHPQLEEITITQPKVDITQNLESQSAAEVTNSRPTPKSVFLCGQNFRDTCYLFLLTCSDYG